MNSPAIKQNAASWPELFAAHLDVVKKRTGPHETAIREFAIEANRLRVGAPLTEFQGVLTGVPTYRGGSDPLIPDAGKRA